MASNSMAFDAASIATILWADRGFAPDTVNAGERLRSYLNKKDLITKICESLSIDQSAIKGPVLDFDTSPGKERIRVAVIKDVEINSVRFQDITFRIHVCNRELKMKSKVTAFANITLESGLNADKTSETINKVFELERGMCKLIFGYISKECDLGNINYISNIASVESNDADIDKLIEYAAVDFPNNSDTTQRLGKKIGDLYQVLLTNDLEPLNKSMTPETIRSLFLEQKVKESKIKMYQSRVAIAVKAINYEIRLADFANRVITAFTGSRCSKSIALILFYDYLGMT